MGGRLRGTTRKTRRKTLGERGHCWTEMGAWNGITIVSRTRFARANYSKNERGKIMENTVKIEAQADYLEKITHANPTRSLSEIIWNSLDADANEINITVHETDMGIDNVTIEDNGSGMPYSNAKEYFGSLGGSWKKNKATTNAGRRIHGKEGQGRFKAFSLGNKVEWIVTYKKKQDYYEYSISGRKTFLDEFKISDEKKVASTKTGVKVEITELDKNYSIFETSTALRELLPIYAPYLASYNEVAIKINQELLALDGQIKNKVDKELLSKIKDDEGKEHGFALTIFEWNDVKQKELYYCDENGYPLEKYEKQIRKIGDYGFSAYLKSDYFSLLNSNGALSLVDMNDDIQDVINETVKEIKEFFLNRYLEDSKDIIQRWKDEQVYPYPKEKAETVIEDAERKVFDILALNINEYSTDFDEIGNQQKKLQFMLLKQAIQTSPSNLSKIIQEVVNLPDEKINDLYELLNNTSLASIISTSKIVEERLKLINGFEEIVFDVELKKHLKERSQLHRILADNTWVFGDEFVLSVDDQSLTEVLRKHKDFVGESIVIDEPVRRLDGSIGIVDLMLSRSIPQSRSESKEHLVIELKAPKVVIGQDELNQIKSYAFAVAKDERFIGLNTRWEFWILSNKYDDYVEMELNQVGYSDGVFYRSKNLTNMNITIKVKTWSQIISECNHRYSFIQDQLSISINKEQGLEYLIKKYAEYLKV